MTNRERIMNLSDEELAKMFDGAWGCYRCSYNEDGACGRPLGNKCTDGIIKWLKAEEFEIPMPELKIGDIINVKFASSFEIKGTIVSKNVVLLHHEGFGCQSFKGHIESLCTEIKRYNGLKGEMEVIWRDGNGKK
jgi:hypothetical protein